MSDSTTYVVELKDQVSAPGAKASGALDRLGSSANKTAIGLAGIATAAIIGVGAAMIDMSIKASEAQEAQLAFAESEYGSAKAAQAVVDAQYKVSAASALTQDKVFELSNKIERAGVSSQNFGKTLQAMADTASVAGEAATKPIEKIIKKVEQLGKFQIKDTDLKGSGLKTAEVYEQLSKDLGKSIDQIKSDMAAGKIAAEDGVKAIDEVAENKFGAAAAGKALSFSAQMQKAKENLGNLFKDVDAKPFLNGLKQVLSVLDSSTKSGAALKKTLTGAMNSFFKAAAASIPYVEAFLLGVGIAALDTYIALKPLIKDIGKVLGNNDKGTANGLKSATTAGKVLSFVVGSLVAGMLAVWDTALFAFQGLAKGATAANKAWHKMTAGVKGVYKSIKGALSKAVDYVSGLAEDFTSAGKAMIDGLVTAIENGASAVAGAVTDMAKGAVTAAKSALGISSPSREFKLIAMNVVKTTEGTMRDGRSKVEQAMRHLVRVDHAQIANDNAGVLRRAAPSSASSGGSVSIAAGAVVIQIYTQPGQSAEDIARAAGRVFDERMQALRIASAG